jgi:hypothetical protein
MPTFRARTRRIGGGDGPATATMDARHHARLAAFRLDREQRLPALAAEKADIKLRLGERAAPLDDRLEMEDRLKIVRHDIRTIKQARNEYLLQHGPTVFDYFEKKKQIDEGEGETTVLDEFFRTRRSAARAPVPPPRCAELPPVGGGLDMAAYRVDVDTCPDCGTGELVAVECEGAMVCSACSRSRPYLVENDKPSYKEPPKEVCFYAYKRINHFREILAQFQAKETTQIPLEVLEAMRQQIKKERIQLSQLTNRKAKDILKKLGHNKYYEHIPFIKDKLGIKPPIMSSELEDTLCRLFMEIQAPYAKYCPDDRVNFLNYYYTVYKLCELLEQTQFLPFFPMLKDREKRIEQDEIWKKICLELDWEFIPTV